MTAFVQKQRLNFSLEVSIGQDRFSVEQRLRYIRLKQCEYEPAHAFFGVMEPIEEGKCRMQESN